MLAGSATTTHESGSSGGRKLPRQPQRAHRNKVNALPQKLGRRTTGPRRPQDRPPFRHHHPPVLNKIVQAVARPRTDRREDWLSSASSCSRSTFAACCEARVTAGEEGGERNGNSSPSGGGEVGELMTPRALDVVRLRQG